MLELLVVLALVLLNGFFALSEMSVVTSRKARLKQQAETSRGARKALDLAEHPERFYDMDFMDIVCVPADMGRYVVENLGKEPIRVHKTCLRDGYQNDPA